MEPLIVGTLFAYMLTFALLMIASYMGKRRLGIWKTTLLMVVAYPVLYAVLTYPVLRLLDIPGVPGVSMPSVYWFLMTFFSPFTVALLLSGCMAGLFGYKLGEKYL